jgi:hypothetical protein
MEWREEARRHNEQRRRRVEIDMSLCHHDISAQHGQHVANIATFDGFFYVICHVVSLIADITEIQQPASAGEARQERQQCD